MPIVEAVAVASSAANTVGGRSPLSKLIEQAMSEAVARAYAEGVHDPQEIRERMLAARTAAKNEFVKQAGVTS